MKSWKLIELSDNKLSNKKLSDNNLPKWKIGVLFYKPITIEEIVICMIIVDIPLNIVLGNIY